jgi:hypothetical protein
MRQLWKSRDGGGLAGSDSSIERKHQEYEPSDAARH